MTDAPLTHTPIFVDRPSERYVAEWSNHIEATGYPETFENVSTSKPETIGELVLLSGEMKVPVFKRENCDRVPCPICHPRQPWFETGRMAWFPEEAVSRFIGHDCAKTHYKDLYRVAEKRFSTERRVRGLIRRWAELTPHVDLLRSLIERVAAPAAALQEMRAKIDGNPNGRGLSSFLFREMSRNSGQIETIFDTGMKDRNGNAILDRATLGTVRGLTFFGKPFVPAEEVASLLVTVNDLENSLPDWSVDVADVAAESEIQQRGLEADRLPSRLINLLDLIRLSRQFFFEDNLKLMEKWGRAPDSPFQSLMCRLEGSKLTIRSITFNGWNHVAVNIPEATFQSLPDIPYTVFNLKETALKSKR